MIKVRRSVIPPLALVGSYVGQCGTKVDCYRVQVPGQVLLEEFVGSFYRGHLFRFERWVIKTFIGRGSSEAQIEDLLAGKSSIFSAWTQTERCQDQLVMCDYQHRTCSWFMVQKVMKKEVGDVDEAEGTWLYFGTVLKPTDYAGRAEWLSYPIFTIFLPVHDIYSRLLLGQAAKSFY